MPRGLAIKFLSNTNKLPTDLFESRIRPLLELITLEWE